jgi:AcrR family transcriptional regulator
MTRKTKTAQERKDEFVGTAGSLFEAKGYEKTSVDDIVGKMGVAKGLFYYYFDSKEEVLALLIDHLISENVTVMEHIAARDDLDAMGKFRRLMTDAAALRARSRRMTLFFHKESNRHLHADIEARSVRLMTPALAQIIEQGMREGVFNTRYPEETALAFFALSSVLGHEVYQRPDEELFRRRVEAALYIIEKLLGAAPGTFDFYRTQALKGPALKNWLRRIKQDAAKGGKESGSGRGERRGRKRGRGGGKQKRSGG